MPFIKNECSFESHDPILDEKNSPSVQEPSEGVLLCPESCRIGEAELAFGVIRQEEKEDYMKYQLLEGTDNVGINTFDANGEFIS